MGKSRDPGNVKGEAYCKNCDWRYLPVVVAEAPRSTLNNCARQHCDHHGHEVVVTRRTVYKPSVK